MRGGRRHFVHSKVMAWVAFDRAVRMAEEFGREGPVDRWRELRAQVHREVCERGFDRERGTFTQSYGSQGLDAALLMIPLVGFLPPDDERVTGTIEAIKRELYVDGFVLRYDSREADDGLPPGEGAFLPCSFWLADCLAMTGPHGRGDRAVRPAGRPGERRRAARRGVRSAPGPDARELPAGLHACRAGQHRDEPGRRHHRARGAPSVARRGGPPLMRAITIDPGKADSAALEEMPEPAAAEGAILVDGVALGICGTDAEIVRGDYGEAPAGSERLILGHESLGRVREAPDGSGFAPGDLVVGIVRRPDPVPCASCAAGEWDFCRNGEYTERGIKARHGYGSERWRIEPDFAVKLDPSLGLLGVLMEPARWSRRRGSTSTGSRPRADRRPSASRHRRRADRPARRAARACSAASRSMSSTG